jgi:hypothetical protein
MGKQPAHDKPPVGGSGMFATANRKIFIASAYVII